MWPCLSYSFQRKYRQIADGLPLERYVNDFVNGRLNSASWGTWGENVASCVWTRGKKANFLLLRFEDMTQDTRSGLAHVAELLSLSVTDDLIDRAIINCSAERMRQLEKLEENQWAATRKHRKDIPL